MKVMTEENRSIVTKPLIVQDPAAVPTIRLLPLHQTALPCNSGIGWKLKIAWLPINELYRLQEFLIIDNELLHEEVERELEMHVREGK